MDPIQPIPIGQPYPALQTLSGFVPGVFVNYRDENDYLSSLDSDTRDYVLKHTDEFRTRQDIVDCVNKLHTGK